MRARAEPCIIMKTDSTASGLEEVPRPAVVSC